MFDYVVKAYLVLVDKDNESYEFSIFFHNSDLQKIEQAILTFCEDSFIPSLDGFKLKSIEF